MNSTLFEFCSLLTHEVEKKPENSCKPQALLASISDYLTKLPHNTLHKNKINHLVVRKFCFMRRLLANSPLGLYHTIPTSNGPETEGF